METPVTTQTPSDSPVTESRVPRRGKRGPRSDKPERILNFLEQYFREHRYPPSVRDIVDGCQLSSTSVADYNLKILEREGFIRRDRERARTISLVNEVDGPTVNVPLMGTIAAGTRSFDTDAPPSEHVSLAREMLRGHDVGDVFALTVRGDSMIDALIAEDDTVILEKTAHVDNGQMAAVWLRDENVCTLKRVFFESSRIRLQPENQTMDPIYTAESNMEIQGRVLSVIRTPR